MIACSTVREALDDWLDEQLEPQERGQIEAHLAECAACARVFEQHREMSGDLRLLAHIADRMAEPLTCGRNRARRRWRPLLQAAAAVLIVAGAARYLTSPRHQDAPQPIASRYQPLERRHEPPAPVFHIDVPNDRLAVRIESSNPHVHIVWLYHETLPADAAPDGESGDASTTPS